MVGADGIAAAFLILFVLAAMGAVLVLAGIVLTIAIVQRRRDQPARRWFQASGALGLIALSPVIYLAVHGVITADRGTLRLDLRGKRSASMLHGHEARYFPENREYHNRRVVIKLPGQRTVRARTKRTYIFTRDNTITKVSIDNITRTSTDGAHALQRIARQLHTTLPSTSSIIADTRPDRSRESSDSYRYFDVDRRVGPMTVTFWLREFQSDRYSWDVKISFDDGD